MKKTLTALVAAATLAGALAIPTDASAQWRRWRGPAFGAFAAGAIIGGALASRPYYGGYGGYYYGGYNDGYYAYAAAPTYYYAPGPVQYEYYGNYYRPYDPCWRKMHGDRFAGCE